MRSIEFPSCCGLWIIKDLGYDGNDYNFDSAAFKEQFQQKLNQLKSKNVLVVVNYYQQEYFKEVFEECGGKIISTVANREHEGRSNHIWLFPYEEYEIGHQEEGEYYEPDWF